MGGKDRPWTSVGKITELRSIISEQDRNPSSPTGRLLARYCPFPSETSSCSPSVLILLFYLKNKFQATRKRPYRSTRPLGPATPPDQMEDGPLSCSHENHPVGERRNQECGAPGKHSRAALHLRANGLRKVNIVEGDHKWNGQASNTDLTPLFRPRKSLPEPVRLEYHGMAVRSVAGSCPCHA